MEELRSEEEATFSCDVIEEQFDNLEESQGETEVEERKETVDEEF